MKKYLGLLTIMLVFVLALSACSAPQEAPAAEEAQAEEAPAAAEEEVEAEEAPAAEEAVEEEAAAEEDSSEAAADYSDQLVIYVTSKPLGTNQFHILGKDALDLLAAQYGVQTNYYESENDPTNREENVRAAVNDGANIIYVLGTEWIDIIPQVASENPDVDFLIADQCVEDQLPNIHCTVFKEHEAAFLIGAMAASLTETGHVGVIGALDIPFLHRYTDAYVEGAQYVNPDIEADIRWVGGDNPFGDPARAKEQALSIYANGADQIFSACAGGDAGVFEASAENDFYSYGVDVNNCALAPGHIVDNLLKHVDVAVLDAVGQILTDDPEALYLQAGVAEDAVGPGAISDNTALNEGCVSMEHPEVIELLQDIKGKIISGEITIEDPMFAE